MFGSPSKRFPILSNPAIEEEEEEEENDVDEEDEGSFPIPPVIGENDENAEEDATDVHFSEEIKEKPTELEDDESEFDYYIRYGSENESTDLQSSKSHLPQSIPIQFNENLMLRAR